MPPSRHSGGSSGFGGHSSFGGSSGFGGHSSFSSHSMPSMGHSSSRPSGPSMHSSSSFGRSSAGSHPSPRPSSGSGMFGSLAGGLFGAATRPSYSSPRPPQPGPHSAPRPRRPRVNQPLYAADLIVPLIRACAGHDYMYFDRAWDYQGKHYEAGYYDEDGTYYKDVAFKDSEDSTAYVDLECEYCGNKARYEWKDGEIPTCTHCGAPMKVADIKTDTLSSDNPASDAGTSDASAASVNPAAPAKSGGGLFGWIRRHWLLSFILLVVICTVIKSAVSAVLDPFSDDFFDSGTTYSQTDSRTNPEIFGNTLYLASTGNGTYTIVSKSSEADKKLKWSSEYDSYYDSDADAYLWYNNEGSPAVWQYWFEGASSKYGDYGWMEYNNGTWYVEKSAGNWVKYTGSTSSFFHIEG